MGAPTLGIIGAGQLAQMTLAPAAALGLCWGLIFSDQGHRLVRAIAHPPTDDAAQGIAGGGHQNGRPEQIGIDFDQAKNGGFRAQWQQGG